MKIIAYIVRSLIAALCVVVAGMCIIGLCCEMVSTRPGAGNGMAAMTLLMFATFVFIQGYRWADAKIKGKKFDWMG